MKKQVVFVDDEPRILDGLRRTFRTERDDWDMHFAMRGVDALGLLKTHKVDVLVTDMCMPGMDGAEVLHQARRLSPATVRVVLSGQFSKASGIRALPVAHQFLPKPCEPAILKATIRHAMKLQDLLSADEIKRAAGAVGALPFLPQTHAALLQLVQEKDASFAAIADIISQDLAMTAKFLQLVNSAFLGLPHEITSVLAAVQRLGIENVKEVVLSAEIMTNFRTKRVIAGFSEDLLHQHSRITAKIAAQLGLSENLARQAAAAALLHDVGKLVMAAQVPNRLERALTATASGEMTLHDAEMEYLGATHAEVGGYILGLWGLPKTIVEAVLQHHSVSPTPPDTLTVVEAVQIANALAGATVDRAAGVERPLSPALQRERLAQMGCEGLLPRWREIARGLSESTPAAV